MFYTKRCDLNCVRKALSRNVLNIGFLGGSITEQSAQHNWADQLSVMLKDAYPDVELHTQNLAIGATTSMLGMMHCIEELQSNHDLIFIEYAVNDFDMDKDLRFSAREGLIRRIKAKSNADIIIVYTYFNKMYPWYAQKTLPDSITDFEIIAQYYQLTSVNMGAYAFDQMQRGLLRLDEWLPDGTHPQYRGSVLYAEVLFDCIKESLEVEPKQTLLQEFEPLCKQNWSDMELLPWSKVVLKGPWIFKETFDKWIHEFLYTSSLQASLSFHTHGRVVLLGTMYGVPSAELCFRINKGQWQKVQREKEEWIQGLGWYRVEVLCNMEEACDLEIEVQADHDLNDIGSITMITRIAVVK